MDELVAKGDDRGVDAYARLLGEPMFFSHFDATTNRRLVEDAGFELVRAEEETQLEGRRKVPYLWVLARKP